MELHRSARGKQFGVPVHCPLLSVGKAVRHKSVALSA
jgi:hypothetical protein